VKQPFVDFKWSWFLPSLVLILLLTACGGDAPAQQSEAAPASLRAAPTMPPARFTPVAQQQFVDRSPTVAAASTESEATPTLAAAAGPDLTRGATVYQNRCASCHGEQGEGVADKGNALTNVELSSSEFDTLLRTGGSGRLGPDHLFGPNAISPSGMEALYAFVQSLAE
jgi:mono/diheme cytochrome c family protein